MIDCTLLVLNTHSYFEENEEHELDELHDSIVHMLEMLIVHAIHQAKLEPNVEKYGVIVVHPVEDDVDRFDVDMEERLYQLYAPKLFDDIVETIDTVEDLEKETEKLISEYNLFAGIAKMNAQNKEE